MIEYYFQNGHISSAHKQEDATDGISMYYFQHSLKVLDLMVVLKVQLRFLTLTLSEGTVQTSVLEVKF